MAHDSITRLLHRLEPDAATLWQEAQALIALATGMLVLDNTTLDKPTTGTWRWLHATDSDKHHAVVQGINLLTLLWPDGQHLVAGPGLPSLLQSHGSTAEKRPLPRPTYGASPAWAGSTLCLV